MKNKGYKMKRNIKQMNMKIEKKSLNTKKDETINKTKGVERHTEEQINEIK
jgi:hypothetical protein